MPLNDTNDPTALVAVTRQHLQEALACLKQTYNVLCAQDIIESAREERPATKYSKLTLRTERAYNHIEGYLENELESE